MRTCVIGPACCAAKAPTSSNLRRAARRNPQSSPLPPFGMYRVAMDGRRLLILGMALAFALSGCRASTADKTFGDTSDRDEELIADVSAEIKEVLVELHRPRGRVQRGRRQRRAHGRRLDGRAPRQGVGHRRRRRERGAAHHLPGLPGQDGRRDRGVERVVEYLEAPGGAKPKLEERLATRYEDAVKKAQTADKELLDRLAKNASPEELPSSPAAVPRSGAPVRGADRRLSLRGFLLGLDRRPRTEGLDADGRPERGEGAVHRAPALGDRAVELPDADGSEEFRPPRSASANAFRSFSARVEGEREIALHLDGPVRPERVQVVDARSASSRSVATRCTCGAKSGRRGRAVPTESPQPIAEPALEPRDLGRVDRRREGVQHRVELPRVRAVAQPGGFRASRRALCGVREAQAHRADLLQRPPAVVQVISLS